MVQAYALAMPCPLLQWAMVLRARYARSGTERAYGAALGLLHDAAACRQLLSAYPMSGTDIACRALSAYPMSGTDLAYCAIAYPMSGTDIACCRALSAYAMSGTDLAYGGTDLRTSCTAISLRALTRYPVLTRRMWIPGPPSMQRRASISSFIDGPGCVSAYARATRCPVLTLRTVLRDVRTEIAYGASQIERNTIVGGQPQRLSAGIQLDEPRFWSSWAMPGAAMGYAAMHCSAMSGTDIGYTTTHSAIAFHKHATNTLHKHTPSRPLRPPPGAKKPFRSTNKKK
eukprot:489456-Rhodomonas_salina.2